MRPGLPRQGKESLPWHRTSLASDLQSRTRGIGSRLLKPCRHPIRAKNPEEPVPRLSKVRHRRLPLSAAAHTPLVCRWITNTLSQYHADLNRQRIIKFQATFLLSHCQDDKLQVVQVNGSAGFPLA